jgi:RNA polymerase sigma factor (sigma-70 family)
LLTNSTEHYPLKLLHLRPFLIYYCDNSHFLGTNIIENTISQRTKSLNKEEQFQYIWNNHDDIINRIVLFHEDNKSLRDDLKQEIYLQIWLSLDNFQENCTLKTWAYRIAVNTSRKHFRNNKKHNTNLMLEPHDIDHVIDNNSDRSFELLSKRENLKALDKYRKNCSYIDGLCFIFYINGDDINEIANIVGISASNLSTKINRLKAQVLKDIELENNKGKL